MASNKERKAFRRLQSVSEKGYQRVLRRLETPEEKAELSRERDIQMSKVKSRRRKVALGIVSSPLERTKRYLSQPSEGRESIKKREKRVSGLLRAAGVTEGAQRYSGAGRPKGSYKYGMPIQIYKKLMNQKRAQYQQYQQELAQRLSGQGFTPEQVQQLKQQETVQELQGSYPPQSAQAIPPQRVQQLQQQLQPTGRKVYAQDMPFHNPEDDNLEFARWRAEKTIHPNTQRLMEDVRRIQNMGKLSNIQQQRRIRERRMLGNQMNLMKAHENMTNVNMDFTGVPEDNILLAPSIFAQEIPGNNIMKNNRLNLLQTRQGGNDLKFW